MICKKHNLPLRICKKEQLFFCPKCRRNRKRREQNAMLRELCGTSAKAARADMGLGGIL